MTTTAVKRRLAGEPEPRAAALAAYEQARTPRMTGLSERRAAAALFAAPAPEDMFRWRVELDCGCIHELLTFGDGRAPHEHRWRDDLQSATSPSGASGSHVNL